MDQYVTGEIIRKLREEKKMTQAELAEKLSVSDKTVSKWENGRGYPDITLIEPIAQALGISMIELLSGSNIVNENRNANMLRTKWYVCPVCGNVVNATGEAVISCCGITLPAFDMVEADDQDALYLVHRCAVRPGEPYREAVSGRSGRGEIQDAAGKRDHFLLQSSRPVRGQGKVSIGLNCGSRRKRQSTGDTDPLCADTEKSGPVKVQAFSVLWRKWRDGRLAGGFEGGF